MYPANPILYVFTNVSLSVQFNELHFYGCCHSCYCYKQGIPIYMKLLIHIFSNKSILLYIPEGNQRLNIMICLCVVEHHEYVYSGIELEGGIIILPLKGNYKVAFI